MNAICETCGAPAIITLMKKAGSVYQSAHFCHEHSPYYRTPEQRAEDDRRSRQREHEAQLIEQAYADYMVVLREHQQRSNTCGPHCDMLMLHSPSVCPVCDTYASDLQAARTRMNIAFSDQQPTDGQRPCPATLLRPYEQMSQWPGNRPEGYSW